jgi:hypothetical protein
MSSNYHSCAKNTGQCVGLKQGLKGYHSCARGANCKKKDREQVEGLTARMKESKAKRTVKKQVQKKQFMKALRKPITPPKKKRKPKAKPQKNKITKYIN